MAHDISQAGSCFGCELLLEILGTMAVHDTEVSHLAWVASHRAVVALRTVEEIRKFWCWSKACGSS